MNITSRIVEDYLSCKYKAHLALAGESGVPHDYEVLMNQLRDEYRPKATKSLVRRSKLASAPMIPIVTFDDLKLGHPIIMNCTVEHSEFKAHFDALKRVDGRSALGEFHYIPVAFCHEATVHETHKRLLAFAGFVIGLLQKRAPEAGIIVCGPTCRHANEPLSKYRRSNSQLLHSIAAITTTDPPRLTLNNHCRQCPYSRQCKEKAVTADDLSLLDRVNEKEVARQHRKGIFTVKQLSYTFRPRRRNRRVKGAARPFNPALQALAIREDTVFISSRPRLPDATTSVYVDMEGDRTGAFVYLIGLNIVTDTEEQTYSIWSDSEADEEATFCRFFELIEGLDVPHIYHYGSYETRVFSRMLALSPPSIVAETLADRVVNVVPTIYANVYFPTYSNGLKDIGRYLGCCWSVAEASGLQTVVWRANWQRTREERLKRDLLQYNQEDCLALKRVTEFLYKLQKHDTAAPPPGDTKAIAFVDDLKVNEETRKWGNMQPAVENFGHIVRCAYFDYQTSKVYIRTNPNVKKANRRRSRNKVPKVPVNDVIQHSSTCCVHCNRRPIIQFPGKGHVKHTIDLRFSKAGIRRVVTQHRSEFYKCPRCTRTFVSIDFKTSPHFGPGVVAWAMYQYVVNRMSFSQIKMAAQECFGVPLPVSRCHLFKEQMALKYGATVDGLLSKIVAGHLVHMDETKIRLKKESGYVFVVTNMEEVVYMYRQTRKTDFVRELLGDFGGVLVTDFYSGYDSLKCLQQKCLVHLIRDLNDDVLKNPFDQELIAIAQAFGSLMRNIVDTIDRYGLKTRYLRKHMAEVRRWFSLLDNLACVSDIAEGYRRRIVNYREKLFVFLEHDNVPWNNNNAEHAVKPFAKYRRLVNGQISERGLADYLVLLSLQRTCENRGVRFLEFLLSGEKDIDIYCQLR